MMIEGLIGVQQAINPRTLQDRMAAYLHPDERRRDEALWQSRAKTE
jgi:flagellar motor component MotA